MSSRVVSRARNRRPVRCAGSGPLHECACLGVFRCLPKYAGSANCNGTGRLDHPYHPARSLTGPADFPRGVSFGGVWRHTRRASEAGVRSAVGRKSLRGLRNAGPIVVRRDEGALPPADGTGCRCGRSARSNRRRVERRARAGGRRANGDGRSPALGCSAARLFVRSAAATGPTASRRWCCWCCCQMHLPGVEAGGACRDQAGPAGQAGGRAQFRSVCSLVISPSILVPTRRRLFPTHSQDG